MASRPKNQTLQFVNGYMMAKGNKALEMRRPATASASSLVREVTDPSDVFGRYSLLRQKRDRESNMINLPFSPKSELPGFLRHAERVLLFKAYYEEDVLSEHRIHLCDIFFYVQDGTIEIIQNKQENSGMIQGLFLRRSRVPKPLSRSEEKLEIGDENHEYLDIDDFRLGTVVEFYKRKFRIADCNESTREYVRENHFWTKEELTPQVIPKDTFSETNKEKMRRESGVPGVNRNRKMHELKQIMETMLGKPSTRSDRGRFLECGQTALCFDIAWNDTDRLYGDVQCFKLMYYLADDTIEILPIHKNNNGREKFPKLLKRAKLPKAVHGPNSSGDFEHYTWQDLSIGKSVTVYNRIMDIARADKFTREFYASRGMHMDEDRPLLPTQEKIMIERQIPPHNGFGSEEDSLRSCSGGINNNQVLGLIKDPVKMREKGGIIQRFNAKLVSDREEDQTRRFVIQFFMEDDTIAIREPPIPNSGVMGGNFLRRQAVKKADGTFHSPSDMYIGNLVVFISHRFILLDADEYTYRLMENDDRTFPFSDIERILGTVKEHVDAIKLYFVKATSKDGYITMAGLDACLVSVGLKLNKQEILTIWRKLDKKGKGKVLFMKLLKLLAGTSIQAQLK